MFIESKLRVYPGLCFRCCYKNESEIYVHVIKEIINIDLYIIEILALKSELNWNLEELIQALKHDKEIKKNIINASFINYIRNQNINYIRNQNKKILDSNVNNIKINLKNIKHHKQKKRECGYSCLMNVFFNISEKNFKDINFKLQDFYKVGNILNKKKKNESHCTDEGDFSIHVLKIIVSNKTKYLMIEILERDFFKHFKDNNKIFQPHVLLCGNKNYHYICVRRHGNKVLMFDSAKKNVLENVKQNLYYDTCEKYIHKVFMIIRKDEIENYLNTLKHVKNN